MIVWGAVLMTVSMIAFAAAAWWQHLGVFVVGLIVSGLAMGLASPSYATAVVRSVAPRDIGVASGMSSTMMNIGMLTGIQAMFVVLGDGREPDDFAVVYLFGGAVAALSIGAALLVRPAGSATAPPATVACPTVSELAAGPEPQSPEPR